MKRNSLIVIIFILIICNCVGFLTQYLVRNFIFQGVTFNGNISNLGSSLVTYSTAMMALLIAMIVILFGMDDLKLKNFKKAGYLHATYLIYMTTFFELGITMALSFLCMSNIQSIRIASLSLTFALITFLLICTLGIQLISIKKHGGA
ncbi:hypothetical protein [Xenorhabdus sp. SGI240]|uniref:hypothetical protein n=1 Tax=Xenorhabdus sp. SGI240 TaxID=3158262 RepID=UPI0032B7EBB2